MPSNFTLNNVLSSTSYNSNVGYNNSWVEVQNDADRLLYAQASYITNNKVSDWGVTSVVTNTTTYVRLPSFAASTVTFFNTTATTISVGRWIGPTTTIGVLITNNGSITLNLVANTDEVAFKAAGGSPTVNVVYANLR